MLTESTHSTIQHLEVPTDLILNTAQMRDAVHVQRHRVPSTELEPLTVVQESATRTIDARKIAADSTGRGRGRGRAVPARLPTSVGGHGRGQGRGESEQIVSTLQR